jgi:integrase
VVVVGSGGERDSRFYPTKEKAEEVIRAVRKEFARQGRKTVQEALDAYEEYLSTDKQNKRVSVANTMYRLGTFFPDKDMLLGDLTPRACEGYYEDLRRRNTRTEKVFSVDSHRTILAAAKTFLRWCTAKPRRWVSRSPIEEVQGVGKRRHGKPQLRIDEARRWVGKATELAGKGEAGAVAALVSLLMGMRASEITSRVVRDLDDEGKLLWIPDAKTEAGKRTLQVPEVLQPHLRALAKGKGSQDRLFGEHWRDWVRKWVKRICVAAKVPEVSAHGMRGLHSTLALEHGASAHVVASSLGHESFSTTVESYAKPEAIADARQRKVMTVLEGGKNASSTAAA